MYEIEKKQVKRTAVKLAVNKDMEKVGVVRGIILKWSANVM
jgi:hypothetical protein